MYDYEAVVTIATEITAWQAAAQQLPLPELRGILATRQHDLARSLDDLNAIFHDHGGHRECTDVIKDAIAEVTRNATAAAVFTLGLCQRTHLAAHQN